MLQSITSGDSILCPIGKAWCQLGSGTNDSDLAVLKLLVPGSLPNNADAPSQGTEEQHTSVDITHHQLLL